MKVTFTVQTNLLSPIYYLVDLRILQFLGGEESMETDPMELGNEF